MKILFIIFCLGLSGLAFACASRQENIGTPQNVPLTQSSVEATPTSESSQSERDSQSRAEIHERMLRGEYLHDGSIDLKHIGDISSVPALLVVLKDYPPSPNGVMPCVTVHALEALREITGTNAGIRYEDWNAWWRKYQKKQGQKKK